MDNEFRYSSGIRFTDYLREDGESSGATAGGTCSADIAPVTYPIGAILRRKKKDDYLEDSLEINGKQLDVPEELEEELSKIVDDAIIDENYVTDNVELALSAFFNEEWHFDGFENNKSVLVFSSDSGCFKIFQ